MNYYEVYFKRFGELGGIVHCGFFESERACMEFVRKRFINSPLPEVKEMFGEVKPDDVVIIDKTAQFELLAREIGEREARKSISIAEMFSCLNGVSDVINDKLFCMIDRRYCHVL